MKYRDQVFFTIGTILLLGSVVSYGFQAMKGGGSFILCFFLIMASLLFFNLPVFLARGRARKEEPPFKEPPA